MKKIEAKIAQGPQRRIDAIKKIEQSKAHQEFLKKQFEKMKDMKRHGISDQ